MNKVLILGANGFLGRHLSSHLLNEGYQVKTVSRKGENIDYKIDIDNLSAWDQIDFEPEIIINCAAILPGGKTDDDNYVKSLFNTNCLGTYNLCKWADKRTSIKYIVSFSSLSVVGKPWPIPLKEDAATYPSGPHALYSLSKLNQEIILNSYPFSHEMRILHPRLSAVFGENMAWSGILCTLIDKALSNQRVELTNGNKVSADYIYVKDVCKYIVALIKKEVQGIINIASGREFFLYDIAKIISDITGSGLVEINNIDKAQEYNRAVIDVSRLKSYIQDLENIDFRTGLQKTIKYRQTYSLL